MLRSLHGCAAESTGILTSRSATSSAAPSGRSSLSRWDSYTISYCNWSCLRDIQISGHVRFLYSNRIVFIMQYIFMVLKYSCKKCFIFIVLFICLIFVTPIWHPNCCLCSVIVRFVGMKSYHRIFFLHLLLMESNSSFGPRNALHYSTVKCWCVQ